MDRDDRALAIQVLIADDDPRVRTALRTFLCAHPGFAVVGEAGDAATTLRVARAKPPTVVLLDVLLPNLGDGLAVLRALTDELRIPVLAISLRPAVRDSALAAGAYQFVDKNGAAEDLLAALRAAPQAQVP
jgi:DNA-binding NarL/FixJ family response regulator